jgi:hypothetical protein
MLPPHGEVILEDDFSEADVWQTFQSPSGNIAIGKNRLNIAINSPRVLLTSFRNTPELGDFYLEITTRASLCDDLDEYGLILRAASEADFLRYSLSCDGQVRLDRITGGDAASPVPWTYSGEVPPGAPGTTRLAVWALGAEMRFFINNRYQFSLNEPVLLSGRIGVFARSASDSPVSISFSELIIYQP